MTRRKIWIPKAGDKAILGYRTIVLVRDVKIVSMTDCKVEVIIIDGDEEGRELTTSLSALQELKE